MLSLHRKQKVQDESEFEDLFLAESLGGRTEEAFHCKSIVLAVWGALNFHPFFRSVAFKPSKALPCAQNKYLNQSDTGLPLAWRWLAVVGR